MKFFFVDKLKRNDVQIGTKNEFLFFFVETLANKKTKHFFDFWATFLYLVNPFK